MSHDRFTSWEEKYNFYYYNKIVHYIACFKTHKYFLLRSHSITYSMAEQWSEHIFGRRKGVKTVQLLYRIHPKLSFPWLLSGSATSSKCVSKTKYFRWGWLCYSNVFIINNATELVLHFPIKKAIKFMFDFPFPHTYLAYIDLTFVFLWST